jgi:16S rRNA processing protein RimM
MDGRPPLFLVVAHLSKPHGTKGELYLWPLTDRPETTFVPGARFRVADETGEAPADGLPPLILAGVRPHRRGFLVRLEGVNDRSASEALRGRYLLRPFEEIEPLEDGEIFYHQLLGALVSTEEGRAVGRVIEVFEMEPADMLEVQGPKGSVLIPFTRSVIRSVDHEAARIVIDPPEGLLDL